MSFPLPQGVCRKVCRPVRIPPRIVKPVDVIRMAKAAVRHGTQPCELTRMVANAVDCKLCDKEIQDVDLGLQYLKEVLGDLDDAAETDRKSVV